MGRRLIGTVPIHEDGGTVWYRPGDEVPAHHARLIGDHAWEDTDEDGNEPELPPGPTPPPLGGPGSGAEAWALYAGELGVDVAADAKRDEIVEALRAAGHPVEQSAS